MAISYDDGKDGGGVQSGVRKIIIDFTTDDTTGAVSGTTRKISGELVKIVTDPGATAPTDNWDVVLTDENGLNPLANVQNSAALIARDTANTEETYLFLLNADSTPIGIALYPIVCGVLTVAVANAGNSKTGRIVIYYKPLA